MELRELPWSRIVLTIWALLFLAAVTFKTVVPGDDPYRCRAALQTGRWIDPPDEDGNRDPFHQWQPDGCMLHQYTSEDIRRCMEGRYIVIGGDSTSRGVAHGIGRLLNRVESNFDRPRLRHKPFNITYHGVQIQRYPAVWMHTLGYERQENFTRQLNKWTEEKKNPPVSIKKQQGPALVYLAAGVWYTNRIYMDKKVDHDRRISEFQQAISNLSDVVGGHGKNMFTDPMDPYDGVGNQVFFAPPFGPSYQGTQRNRIHDADRRTNMSAEMRDWLHEVEDDLSFPLAWSIPGLVENQNHTWIDPLLTGFHVKDIIAETRANIVLNLRCNAKLDRMKPYPHDRTCCTDYGVKPLVQLGLVAAGMAYLVACIIFEVLDLLAGRDEPAWSLLNMQAGAFLLPLLMCYFADRTQMMAKGSKLWQLQDFGLLCLPCIAIALITIRRSRSAPKEHMALNGEPDQPFLSRDQTDEWKGWMQFVILIYHWVNSQSDSIYIGVRLLVAAYLFQTGYGHTLFFLNKKDFSFNRAAAVLLRLNLLSCSLAYFMDTDYMLYYFSPLVTFWFLVVYATMAVGHKRYNDDFQIVLAKICISAVLVSGIALATPATKWLFALLRTVFNIQWSYTEWQYRVSLDIFIVYIGMLAGVVNFEMERSVNLGLRLTLAIAGFVAICAYFHATTQMTMNEYKHWHPYLSFVPVLAFVAIRNVSAPIRNFHSKAMAWLGRCSLETYTLQFHLLLAADTKGILIVDGFYGDGTLLMDRWRSLIIIVPIFLWISSTTATATGYITKVILRTSPESEKSGPSTFAWATERMPGAGSWISAPKIRIACIFMVMVLLNILSPSHVELPAPDGYTPHRVHGTQTAESTFSTPIPTPNA
ncbi:hypothetical protein NM208_g12056 [Fusarium decemcellulare]|uniref:Uncharacterized protein n=1 Tax=Fusarium decemcellulare TaxID=57161 RepID=A0ACC1RRE0_9HYPO|nr:hypothetical protein NM208_g12056 [Fusarium decemcellulare]